MAITAIVVGTVGVGYSIYAGEQQKKQQKKQLALQEQANRDAKQTAKEQADRADVEMNRPLTSVLDLGRLHDTAHT